MRGHCPDPLAQCKNLLDEDLALVLIKPQKQIRQSACAERDNRK